MPTAKRAVIYTRVSRDDDGTSTTLTTQLEKCQGIANLHDYDVVETIKETQSAYNDRRKRPDWDRVIGMAERGEIDVIIAYNMDRMTRSMKELERLILATEEHEVGVRTFEGEINLTNEHGRMVARILTAVARAEVERKGARQKRANAQRRAEGEAWPSGWVRFGYTRDMQIVAEQAELIQEAAKTALAGGSLKGIARKWRELGVTTPRSEKGAEGWTHNGVKSILLNPINAGLNTYQGEVVGKGNWEPILSEATHYQLVAVLTDPQRLTRRNGSNGRTPENLLTGIARCATCGKTVNAGSSNGKRVYKCPSEHVNTSREVDDLIKEIIPLWASINVPGASWESRGNDPDNLAVDLARLEERQEALAQAFAEGVLSEGPWRKANDAVNAEKNELTERFQGADDSWFARYDLSATGFEQMTLLEQRAFLSTYCEVTLHSRNRKKNVPIEQQVSVFIRDPRHEEETVWRLLVGEHEDAWDANDAQTSLWSQGQYRQKGTDQS